MAPPSSYQPNMLCRRRIFQKQRKVPSDNKGDALEYHDFDDEMAESGNRHIMFAFRRQMAEDLEWALLIRQRLVFPESANEDTKKANEEEIPAESPSSVSNYYLCPPYVLPDPKCFFDYSKFTIPADDQPIYHRLGPDGQEGHLQNQMRPSTETGNFGWYPVQLTETEFQQYLRNQKYCTPKIMVQGSCQGHPGDIHKGKFTCCQQGTFTRGCSQIIHHVNHQTPWQVWKDYELHETPENCRSPRKCIVLDCKMGAAHTGEPELVRVAAVDYFTGETLLDALVFPQVKMWHLNSKYSGVNWAMLHKARKEGKAISGRQAARRRLWEIVGTETIVIVHGGHQDFLSCAECIVM